MTGDPDARRRTRYAAGTAAMLWMAQPPLGAWPIAWFALVPVLALVTERNRIPRSAYIVLWLASMGHWLVSLQGLRHAHPLMFLPWIALASYLGIYLPLFVAGARRLLGLGVPLMIAVPVSWVGWECVRNYALTGISAAMLGHAMADVPPMIQIADLFGTYGVSFVLAAANVPLYLLWRWRADRQRDRAARRQLGFSAAAAIVLVSATLAYGTYRLSQPIGPATGTVALIQRDEQTEYAQDREREIEIYRRYAEQTLAALGESDTPVDVVVWPESMFTGGLPWTELVADTDVAESLGYSAPDLRALVEENQQFFLRRTTDLQRALAGANGNSGSNGDASPPGVIGGSSVVRYAEVPEVYSGVVLVSPDGELGRWYGKSHLVMFGEYIPLVGSIPGLRDLIPPGMGIAVGRRPERFRVGELTLSPNVCIESAVERVTVNQLARLLADETGELPDAIVNVTNDAWFDGTSVVAHHLRCAQLVAVGCRRPLLSAGNGGPTAWIDSNGRVVEQLGFHDDGWVLARPAKDARTSWYVRIGDLPAKLLAAVVGVAVLYGWVMTAIQRRRAKSDAGSPEGSAETT